MPWFNWGSNALSDLGHSVNSDVSYIFNLGLLLGGFFLIVYSIAYYRCFCLKCIYVYVYEIEWMEIILSEILSFNNVYPLLKDFQ